MDAWMELQMKAIGGDRIASAMIDRVAAAAGANPCEMQRLEVWSRLREAEEAPKEALAKPLSTQLDLSGGATSVTAIQEQLKTLTVEHGRALDDARRR